jgi:hypothetical protein
MPHSRKSESKLSAEALKRLYKALPDLRIRYETLVVPPTDHLLRCFCFDIMLEREVYFWRVVMPLYRPPGFLVLNYGERLLNGQSIALNENDLDRTVQYLVDVISSSELAKLQRFRTPKDFLEQTDWSSLPSSPNYRLDLGLSHFMAGDVPAALEIFEELAAAKLRPIWAETVNYARELADELRMDRALVERKISTWEHYNVGVLGLTPRRRTSRHQVR